jgi:hypothetical protein
MSNAYTFSDGTRVIIDFLGFQRKRGVKTTDWLRKGFSGYFL